MIAHAHLAGHHHVIAGGRAAGDADLRAEHVVPADAAVVGDHHQVVDFRALADDRRAVGAAVDGRAGADFHVGPQNHIAQLGRKHVPAVGETIAETIGPQHGVGMDHAPRPDNRVFVQHGVGKDGHILADLRAGHDVYAAVDRRAGADRHVVADGGKRMDVDVLGDLGRGTDDGQRADADPPGRPLRDGNEARRWQTPDARRRPGWPESPGQVKFFGAITAAALHCCKRWFFPSPSTSVI